MQLVQQDGYYTKMTVGMEVAAEADLMLYAPVLGLGIGMFKVHKPCKVSKTAHVVFRYFGVNANDRPVSVRCPCSELHKF